MSERRLATTRGSKACSTELRHSRQRPGPQRHLVELRKAQFVARRRRLPLREASGPSSPGIPFALPRNPQPDVTLLGAEVSCFTAPIDPANPLGVALEPFNKLLDCWRVSLPISRFAKGLKLALTPSTSFPRIAGDGGAPMRIHDLDRFQSRNYHQQFIFGLLFSFYAVLPVEAVRAQPSDRISDPNLHSWYMYFGDHPFGQSRWGLHFDGQLRRQGIGQKWQQLLLRPGANYNLTSNVQASGGYAFIKSHPTVTFQLNLSLPSTGFGSS